MEIEGWIIKKDMKGNYLFDNPMNPKDYYMITLIKDFAIECSFLKSELEEIPLDKREDVIKDKLKMAIFEYGSGRNFPWMR